MLTLQKSRFSLFKGKDEWTVKCPGDVCLFWTDVFFWTFPFVWGLRGNSFALISGTILGAKVAFFLVFEGVECPENRYKSYLGDLRGR